MGIRAILSPTRSVLNPILSDEPVIEVEGSSADVFFTLSARRLNQYMELVIAGGAGVCLASAAILKVSSAPTALMNLFTLLAFAIAGIPAIQSVWEKIGGLRIDVDVLMLLGAALAAYIGSPLEGALLLFLFALSGGLEALALRKTQSAIIGLQQLAPSEANVIQGNASRRVPLRQVPIGAMILIRPGEKVPLDGEIVEGNSSLDESAITGESIARDCTPGDSVFSGTQNLNGRLVVRVTKLAGDSTLARVIQLVTEAKHNPARAQRLIDRIGPPYSALVIVGAVLVAYVCWLAGVPGDAAMKRGIAALIVASPCALIIATPVAYLSAIAGAAKYGLLIKGGAHLETVARAGAIAFDKTGTLTTGIIRLTDVVATQKLSQDETLTIAGAISAASTHPLSNAVTTAICAKDITPPGVDDYNAIPGEGAEAVVDGRKVWIGKPEAAPSRTDEDGAAWIKSNAATLRAQGKTVSALLVDGAPALLAFEDTIREGSSECLRRLRDQGVRHVAMLTGDHAILAKKVAAELELDDYQAELVPEDKVTATRALQDKYGSVCLVGDGINDAPALAHADTGVAMGAMGAPIAMDAADIVLMKDRIEAVAWLHDHSRRTAQIVRQNLTLAIGVIAVLGVFAVLGHIPLPLAVIGHEGSTVVVAINALRLLRLRP